MSIFGKNKDKIYPNENIADILIRIKKGDYLERESFIEENKSNILKVVCDTLGKSTIPKNSKEFEIGLAAFNSAIDSYDLNSRDIFLSYAQKVIKEWIIGYIRDNQSIGSSPNFAVDEKNYIYYSVEDQEKLAIFKNKLWELGIVLQDLVPDSPTDDNSIQSALKIARILAEDKKIYNKLFSKKDMPYEDLDDNTKAQKKFIEKYKKYILVLCVSLKEDLKILGSYYKNIEKGKGFAENIGLVLEIYKNQAIILTFQGRFVITRILAYNDMVIGKQIKLDNYNIKSGSQKESNPNRIYFVVAAILAILVVSLFVFLRFASQDNKTVLSGNIPQNTHASSKTNPTNTLVPTANKAAVEEATPAAATEAPSPTVEPTSSDKAGPTGSTEKPKPSPRPTPAPTGKKHTSTPTSKRRNADGIPAVPAISSDLYVVRVGEKYTIFMNMNGGNNATSLNLYENDEIISVKELTDNTPNAQSLSISITAKYEGMYKYRWELVNDFGTTRSSSIWVKIVSR